MTIINFLSIAIAFFFMGMLCVFFQDKVWEFFQHMRKLHGDNRKVHRTEGWETSTRAIGIVFLLFSLVPCYAMLVFLFQR